MKIALVGFGVENQAAYRYWQTKGQSPVICDQDTSVTVPEGAQAQLGDNYLDNLDRFDLIIRSVGIHPSVILDKNPSVKTKITTAVNLFFEDCKTPIIGVTGTKGKGTTSTLIHKILEAAGKKSVLAGNIGTPMLDVLPQAAASNYVILELSSFQLYDLKKSASIAVCLMVVPEHLNWHRDFEDYKNAKANLFRYQNSNDGAVYNALNKTSREIAATTPAAYKYTYGVADTPEKENETILYTCYVKDGVIFYRNQPIMDSRDVKLLGRHNLENVCAAIATTWPLIDGNVEAIRQAVTSFSGLEFRLQLVRQHNGIAFYNDSFSTTPETAIAALRSIIHPKILIAGGSDKGSSFEALADEIIKNNVQHVLAIGQTGPTIASLLKKRGYDKVTQEGLSTMQAIVAKAIEVAEPGDAVLLSTGCASFGMFKDYKDRGRQFNQAVLSLA